MTMVYVTHDQEEALSMSQRVAVMSDGKIVQFDSPDMLYNEPATRYVCEFVGRTNVIRGEVSRHDGDLCETANGLVGRTRERVAVGDSCVVCVRPERMTLSSNGAGGVNGLRGRISERVFLGQTTNYVVDLEHGGRIEASRFSDADQRGRAGDRPMVAVGDEVTATFAPEDALVFAADAADGDAVPANEVEAALPD
jgi:ABC-type Fe3+/spermidine/putrescine transport system ATPase subunit